MNHESFVKTLSVDPQSHKHIVLVWMCEVDKQTMKGNIIIVCSNNLLYICLFIYTFLYLLILIYLVFPLGTFILAPLNYVTGVLRAHREGAQVNWSISKLVPEINHSRFISNEVIRLLKIDQAGVRSSSPAVVLGASHFACSMDGTVDGVALEEEGSTRGCFQMDASLCEEDESQRSNEQHPDDEVQY